MSLERTGGDFLLSSPAGDFLSTYAWDVHKPVLWDVGTGKSREATQIGHRDAITAEAFSHDGALLATGGSEGTIMVWNVADLDRRSQLPKVRRWGQVASLFSGWPFARRGIRGSARADLGNRVGHGAGGPRRTFGVGCCALASHRMG